MGCSQPVYQERLSLIKEGPIYTNDIDNEKNKINIDLLSAEVTTIEFYGLRVKGIIQNNGNNNIRSIEAIATIYAENSSYILDCYSLIDILQPNETFIGRTQKSYLKIYIIEYT